MIKKYKLIIILKQQQQKLFNNVLAYKSNWPLKLRIMSSYHSLESARLTSFLIMF